jgi:hypothetical protein
MRRIKKFAQGGKATRAQGKMDRRMADIEKDYKIALAKGKSEKVAQAKRDQRIADAKDDFAKRTGADRTETRAAEKEAEARLRRARRSPDKDMQRVTVADEAAKTRSTAGSLASAKVDLPKLDVPKVGAADTKKPVRARRSGTSTYSPRALGKLVDEVTRPSASQTRTGVSRLPSDSALIRGTGASTAPTTRAGSTSRLPRDSALLRGTGASTAPKGMTRKEGKLEEIRRAAEAPGASRYAKDRYRMAKETGMYAKGGKVKGYAKGGKIDGCAVRGKTRAIRKK